MYLAYTYFVKNKITNQFYYGSRCKNIKLNKTPEEDFWIIYFTSSKKVKQLIKEHGKESFEFNIIEKSTDYNLCYWTEQGLIKDNITNSLCINKQYQDKESGSRKFSSDGPCTQERRKAISKSKQGENNHFYGKAHTQAARDKISLAGKGKIFSEEHKNKISVSSMGHKRTQGNKNGMFMHTYSEETKKKQSDAASLRFNGPNGAENRKKLSDINKKKGLIKALSRYQLYYFFLVLVLTSSI